MSGEFWFDHDTEALTAEEDYRTEQEAFDAHYGDDGPEPVDGDDFPTGDRTNEIRNAPGQLRLNFGTALR